MQKITLLDRQQTCDYLRQRLLKKQRIVVSRYADGEYLLMTKAAMFVGSGHETTTISEDLISAFLQPKQLVCINMPKQHNIDLKDKWYKAHRYFIGLGNHSLYGHANWNVHDYTTNCDILPQFFKGKILLVSGHAEIAKSVLSRYQIDITYYSTPAINAAKQLSRTVTDIDKIVQKNTFNNILFACGKTGKILLSRLVDTTQSNLIDFGAVINAILQPHTSTPLVQNWGMSWAKKNKHEINSILLRHLSFNFLRKI